MAYHFEKSNHAARSLPIKVERVKKVMNKIKGSNFAGKPTQSKAYFRSSATTRRQLAFSKCRAEVATQRKFQ